MKIRIIWEFEVMKDSFVIDNIATLKDELNADDSLDLIMSMFEAPCTCTEAKVVD